MDHDSTGGTDNESVTLGLPKERPGDPSDPESGAEDTVHGLSSMVRRAFALTQRHSALPRQSNDSPLVGYTSSEDFDDTSVMSNHPEECLRDPSNLEGEADDEADTVRDSVTGWARIY